MVRAIESRLLLNRKAKKTGPRMTTGRLLKNCFLPLQISSMALGVNVPLRRRWKVHA
jgi:hypothetical protein